MKKHSIISLSRLLMLALLLASVTDNGVSAQDLTSELISYPTKTLEQLSESHRQLAYELTDNGKNTSFLVKFNSVRETVKGSAILLTLPGDTKQTKVVLTRIEYSDEANYTLAGRVENTLLTAITYCHFHELPRPQGRNYTGVRVNI